MDKTSTDGVIGLGEDGTGAPGQSKEEVHGADHNHLRPEHMSNENNKKLETAVDSRSRNELHSRQAGGPQVDIRTMATDAAGPVDGHMSASLLSSGSTGQGDARSRTVTVPSAIQPGAVAAHVNFREQNTETLSDSDRHTVGRTMSSAGDNNGKCATPEEEPARLVAPNTISHGARGFHDVDITTSSGAEHAGGPNSRCIDDSRPGGISDGEEERTAAHEGSTTTTTTTAVVDAKQLVWLAKVASTDSACDTEGPDLSRGENRQAEGAHGNVNDGDYGTAQKVRLCG